MKAVDALLAWTVRCMANGQTQWTARTWLALLRPASHLYGGVIRVRTALFAYGLVGVRRVPIPVVSVGNLIAGGSGKTPFVEMLARRLHGQGHRVAVILRGYRGGSAKPRVISDGRRLFLDPPAAADEAYLLARHLPGVAVLTGADRYRVARIAMNQLECGIIILDDGFQHRGLHRDLDIVLVNAGNPLGYGRLLPSGLLRERPDALARADLLVVTHADSGCDVDAIKRVIRRYSPTAPIVLATHRPLAVIREDGERFAPDYLVGKRLVAFSGIANPGGFETALTRLGAVVLDHRVFPDHYAYSAADLEALWAIARKAGASLMVTTEKDMVKLRRLDPDNETAPLYALSIALELLEGAETLDGMVNGVVRSGVP